MPYIETGTKFTVARAGYVTGVRFYRAGSEPTMVHTGTLWDAASSSPIGSVTFTVECSGFSWQGQNFTTPLPVQPGSTYVISVGTSRYADVVGGLTNAVTSNNGGDVVTVVGGNGV